jgi:hypothetical protein
MMKKTLGMATVLAACLGSVAPAVVAAPVSVQINMAPPAPRAEAVPAPRRGYVWVPGYWNWTGHRHTWVPGTWMRERQGYVYARPQWVERGGRWELRRGQWGRGDRDRDGVPNRADRDRDGDGVPNYRDRKPDNPRRN